MEASHTGEQGASASAAATSKGYRSQAATVAFRWRAGSLHCSCPGRLGSSLQHANIATGTTWAWACDIVETLSAPPAERRACVPSDANVVAASPVLIDLTNQQVDNEAVAQRIRPEPYGDVGGLGCFNDDASELPRASRLHRVLPRNSLPSRCIRPCCRPTFHHSRTSARAGPMRAWLCDSASSLPCATRSSMLSLSRLQPSASTPPRHAGGRHMTASCKPTPETGPSGYGPQTRQDVGVDCWKRTSVVGVPALEHPLARPGNSENWRTALRQTSTTSQN